MSETDDGRAGRLYRRKEGEESRQAGEARRPRTRSLRAVGSATMIHGRRHTSRRRLAVGMPSSVPYAKVRLGILYLVIFVKKKSVTSHLVNDLKWPDPSRIWCRNSISALECQMRLSCMVFVYSNQLQNTNLFQAFVTRI